MFSKDITKDEINFLPLGQYEGHVEVILTTDALAKAYEEIKMHSIVGFDTESKPAFRKGVWNPVVLLQIAIPEKVFLIRMNYTGFTEEIFDFFTSKQICKVGISIRDDIKDLQKTWSQEKGNHIFDPDNVLDLNHVASTLDIPHAGVRKLTAIFLKFRVSKSQQTSNWENAVLNEKQIRYAATDAWVCLEIYNLLKASDFI